MKRFAAATTFNDSGYTRYGKKMVESFDTYWPQCVDLYVYYEGTKPIDLFSERIHFIDLLQASPDLVRFKEKYHNDPLANGKLGNSPHGIKRPNITSKHINSESFLYDAVRFSHKVFCQIHASTHIDTDIIFCMDADTLTFNPISEQFLETILPDKYYCSYLNREPIYTETGFLAYNTKHRYHDEFMNRYRSIYMDDLIFKLKEWHDCEAFDTVRKQMTNEQKINCYSLTKPNSGNHPFVNSILGEYMDHLKGQRKDIGRTPHNQVKNNRHIKYWSR